MRTLVGVVLLWVLACVGVGTAEAQQVTAEREVKDRVVELTVRTTAFAAPTKVHVVLPAGYEAEPQRRWPVVYFTAGTQNRFDTFVEVLKGDELTKEVPAIVVSPDANSGYWSDWFNGGAGGPPKYETWVIDELIPLIDARYRTLADRAHRAVFGISMGGYGAMMLAARHPDRFVAAATLSGAVDSNLEPNGTVLSYSSTYDGAPYDAIYGPRRTQEVRWRGHNPVDMAENLRDVDVQVLTANGVLNPGIGERFFSGDTGSCGVEGLVHRASVSLHERLAALRKDHVWRDYGAGCHTFPNFTREIADALKHFQRVLADPPGPPSRFTLRRIEPGFDVYGWQVAADPGRALEFLRLDVDEGGVALEGSGRTTVTSPPRYRGLRRVDVDGAPVVPDGDGRVRFDVDLGPARTVQARSEGSQGPGVRKRVTLVPHAIVRITSVQRTRRGLRVCAEAVGGTVRGARIRAGGRSVQVDLGAAAVCRVLKVRRRGVRVEVRGRDGFGHAVRATRRAR